jgi:glycosyltransferase involved in cell wall biosynthesis
MPERPALSVIVITRNESARIRRCLDGVRWAEELVVVDDVSADATAEICRASGARVIVRPMREGFGEQKAFALAQAQHPWVLSIDADEVVTPALRCEIEAALADPGRHVGYRMPRLTDYLGRQIRHCGWYPLPVLRLFRRDRARFSDALVHEEVLVEGPVGDLHTDLLHWSYDSLAIHAAKTRLYSGLEARMLERRGVRADGLGAWWLLLVRPAWVFVRKYVVQRGWREGWHGLVLCVLAAFGVFVANVRLAERTGWLRVQTR